MPFATRLPSAVPVFRLVCATLLLSLGVVDATRGQGAQASLPDLDFGVIAPGVARGLTLRICNTGIDTLTFPIPAGDSVLTWSDHAFRISQRDLIDLRSRKVAPGACTSITVSFLTGTAGSYRTVARLRSNGTGRDSSIWTARVTEARPTITSLDFADRWLVASACSRNADTAYEGTLYLSNLGTGPMAVAGVRLDEPSGSYSVVPGSIGPGDVIQPASSGDTPTRPIRILFAPKNEVTYSGALTVTMTDSSSVTAAIAGNGWNSHVAIDDSVDFGVASTRPEGYSRRSLVVRGLPGRPATVTGLRFDPTAEFSLVASSRQLPATLRSGDLLVVDLLFHPGSPGDRRGTAILLSDASSCEDSTAILLGTGTDAAGVDTDAPGTRLRIHPNPASTVVLADVGNGTDSRVILQLYDLLGRPHSCDATPVAPGRWSLDVRDMAPGRYLLRAVGEDGVVTGALVIE